MPSTDKGVGERPEPPSDNRRPAATPKPAQPAVKLEVEQTELYRNDVENQLNCARRARLRFALTVPLRLPRVQYAGRRNGRKLRNPKLHMTIFWICVAIGVLVFGAMLVSMILHRKAAGAEPATFHESTNSSFLDRHSHRHFGGDGLPGDGRARKDL